jgi:hypothetical protein
LPSPITGNSKSWAEIKTGRISPTEVAFEVASEGEFDEHDESGTMKSAAVKRAVFAFGVTIAISIY